MINAMLTEAALSLGSPSRAKRRQAGELITAMINGLASANA
jgi:hypothetical protein